MTMTIERILAGSRAARLVVDDVSWSSEDLLRSGGWLADEISRQFVGVQILTVSTSNVALIIAAVTAAGHLRIPVLLLDPGAASTRFASADDVLISDNQFPGCGHAVTINGNVECYLARRENGRSSALPSDSILFQTSGSTAAPRAVVKLVAAVLRDSARIAGSLHGGSSSADVVCAAPVFHSYGFTPGLLAGLLVDAKTTFRPPSSLPQSLAKVTARTGAGTLIALPNHIHMIAAAKSLDFTGMTQVVSAGAPLRPEAVTQVRRDHSFHLLNAYGTSEVGTMAIASSKETSAPGSIGEPLDGVEVRIGPGDGELLVRNRLVRRRLSHRRGIAAVADRGRLVPHR